MANTAKIAISVPKDILEAVEAECKATGLSRSQFFSHIAEAFLKEHGTRKADEQYVEAYRRLPETAEEIGFARETSKIVLAKEPWE